MAWGLKAPEGFGKYCPSGDLVDWHKQLIDHAVATRHEMSDELQTLIFDDENRNVFASYIADKFCKNMGPVVEAECPQEFRTEKSYKELHSMISIPSRLIAVDEGFKELIERFEPNVHQFFPIPITMPRGKIFPKQYYVLVIRQFIEGFVLTEGTFIDDSIVTLGKAVPRYYPINENKSGFNKIEVSKTAIGKAHLWRDTRMIHPNVFISDALQEAIKDAGLTIFRHYKLKEIM